MNEPKDGDLLDIISDVQQQADERRISCQNDLKVKHQPVSLARFCVFCEVEFTILSAGCLLLLLTLINKYVYFEVCTVGTNMETFQWSRRKKHSGVFMGQG